MQFLDVKTDFAFKKVFGSEQSKEILIDFLNAIIDFEDESKITDLTIVDPYQIPLIKGMKDSYVDVKAILSNETKVIIEMQVLNFEGFEKRILYNAAKLYSTQLMKAQSYETLNPIIALTITDFIMFEEFEKVISYFAIFEKKELIKYNNDIELIFIELPKFNKGEQELETITDKWIYFIKNAGELDFIPESFKEPSILEAFEIANTASLSEEELEIQFKRRDYIIMNKGAIEKSRKEGRKEREIEIAKISLAQGLDIKLVSIITGLDEKIIKELKEQIGK
jgi:predicted transposase/invertase (TIGR01784 family)